MKYFYHCLKWFSNHNCQIEQKNKPSLSTIDLLEMIYLLNTATVFNTDLSGNVLLHVVFSLNSLERKRL